MLAFTIRIGERRWRTAPPAISKAWFSMLLLLLLLFVVLPRFRGGLGVCVYSRGPLSALSSFAGTAYL
jgi:hypothetical protein